MPDKSLAAPAFTVTVTNPSAVGVTGRVYWLGVTCVRAPAVPLVTVMPAVVSPVTGSLKLQRKHDQGRVRERPGRRHDDGRGRDIAETVNGGETRVRGDGVAGEIGGGVVGVKADEDVDAARDRRPIAAEEGWTV